MGDADAAAFEVRPLDTTTWDAFVALCDRHGGGGFGGCYCTWFHRETHSSAGSEPERTAESTREYKHDLVTAGGVPRRPRLRRRPGHRLGAVRES